MPSATVRANARTLPETKSDAAIRERDAAISERVDRRYNQPGLLREGLELLGRMQLQNDRADSLAAELDAARKAEDAIARDDATTDEELGAAVARTGEIADRILALSGAHHLPTIRLKALVYLWAGEESLESLSERATATNQKALVSLLRDLGVDRPAA
jgi:hypothetical protein